MLAVTCINGSIRLAVGDGIDLFVDTMTKDDYDDLVYLNDTLSEGRVEICVDGRYGTICADGDRWSFNEAAVVCRQLGFTAYGMCILYTLYTYTCYDMMLKVLLLYVLISCSI